MFISAAIVATFGNTPTLVPIIIRVIFARRVAASMMTTVYD